MKEDSLVIQDLLQQTFNIVDCEIEGSRILKPKTKFFLPDALRLVCENADDELLLEDDYMGVLRALKIEQRGILSFEYQSGGPMVFSHALYTCDFGDKYYYIVQSIDGEDSQLIANIEKKSYPFLLPSFLKRYYSSNGRHYSDHEMFGSLPSTTTVLDSNISIELLKECYRLFLDNIVERYPQHNSWFGEQEEMLLRFENPNIMKRSLKILQGLPDITDLTKYLRELEEGRDKGSKEIGDREKEIILTLLIYYRTSFSLLSE